MNMHGLDKAKIPIAWLFFLGITLSSIMLFLTDIKSIAKVNEVEIKVLDEKVKVIENDIKEELRIIRNKIDLLSNYCRRN